MTSYILIVMLYLRPSRTRAIFYICHNSVTTGRQFKSVWPCPFSKLRQLTKKPNSCLRGRHCGKHSFSLVPPANIYFNYFRGNEQWRISPWEIGAHAPEPRPHEGSPSTFQSHKEKNRPNTIQRYVEIDTLWHLYIFKKSFLLRANFLIGVEKLG